ncbi:MAG: flagellar biosynthesis protein FlhF [Butyrivibrio sp.]|jgi:flagellar biosynthesis protein FlhF|nr:flagellar biosynthesis protein FlhF [Butyrivibrio sp.]MCR4635710.1 flagellar biosynthesis protein FlhF [Butyrivibrio sp.]
MIIKKFVGKTEEDATQQARDELGTGIVVMNVRPVRRVGFWSFLQKPKTEVTVALEEEPDLADRIVRPKKSQITPDKDKETAAVEEPVDINKKLVKAAQSGILPPLKVAGADSLKLATTNAVAAENATASSVVLERAGVTVPSSNSVIEEKLDSLHSLLEQNIVRPQKDAGSSKDALEHKESTNASSNNSTNVNSKDDPIPDETLSFIKLLYNTMIENEVDERYVNELTDEAHRFTRPGIPLEYFLSNVYQKMILKFGKPEEITPSENGVKAEIFIGPTGVGKTTTIAKLASNLSVTAHKKVALITVDTYRIAAAEQLRTYASILEIPFRVIYSVEDIRKAADDFQDMDYIMVDTAGHSIHNDEQKSEVGKFVDALKEKMDTDTFLVMSASTKYRDLLEIVDAYKEDFDYKLIFTKMDETGAVGNLYNIRLHTGAPMSYITNGQNVPDDIAVFDAQRVVKSLLGGKGML